jgi:DNA modification methylase
MVLDPFAGSGTTLEVAMELGRKGSDMKLTSNSTGHKEKNLDGRISLSSREKELGDSESLSRTTFIDRGAL